MSAAEVFTVRDEEEGLQVLGALRARYPARLRAAESGQRVYYDTFDWRLRRKGRTLGLDGEGEGAWLVLVPLDGGVPRRARVAQVPGFAAELPSDELARDVARITRRRRLLPRVGMRVGRRTLDVLDPREKTVARVVLEVGRSFAPDRGAARGGTLPARLSVVLLRGYEEHARELARTVREELGLTPCVEPEIDLALASCGLPPAGDPGKPALALAPEATAEEALRAALLRQLDALEALEPGVRAELDVEFLHDFRVAVRRSRSLLRLLGDVLDEERVVPFAEELRRLGELSGPARDLDVLLEELAGDEALRPLAQHLRAARAREQERLRAELGSERVQGFRAAWRAFLSGGPQGAGEAARRPAAELVSGRAVAAVGDLARRARRAREDSPARELHRLRIRGKRLRYLLEVFAGLWDEERLGPHLRGLRKLQDVLGRFHDRTVQAESLRRHALAMDAAGEGSAALFLAIGGRIEAGRRGERRLRRKLRRRCRRLRREAERLMEALGA